MQKYTHIILAITTLIYFTAPLSGMQSKLATHTAQRAQKKAHALQRTLNIHKTMSTKPTHPMLPQISHQPIRRGSSWYKKTENNYISVFICVGALSGAAWLHKKNRK